MSNPWCVLIMVAGLVSWVVVPSAGAAVPDVPGAPIPVPVGELDRKYQLVGRTRQPLFEFIRVEGVVVEGPTKGFEGGPNLRVQRVGGVATQEDIQLKLRAAFRDNRQRRRAREDDESVVVEKGKTYEFGGYEAADFVGTPFEAYEAAGIPVTFQTCDVYLSTSFVPLRSKEIPAIEFAPRDFLGRKALLQGSAVSREGKGFIEGGWRLLVNAGGPWPQWMEGKPAEALGTVRRGADDRTFVAEGAAGRLVRLEDQVGRTVELRGRAWSMNGHWWFEYRGQDLYVDGIEKLPGWTADNQGRPVAIRGTLVRARRPDLEQITRVDSPPLKEYFVVTKASWEPVERLLAPERSKTGGD